MMNERLKTVPLKEMFAGPGRNARWALIIITLLACGEACALLLVIWRFTRN